MTPQKKSKELEYRNLTSHVKLPIASISHSTTNLGDEIQTIAADQFVNEIVHRFDREQLAVVLPDQDYVMILNGWFAHDCVSTFPPHLAFLPVIIGFHIHPPKQHFFTSEEGLEYLREHGPVGCRDRSTLSILQKHNLDCYLSSCLTLTLPRRKREPENPLVVIVDIDLYPKFIIPKKLRLNAVVKTHAVSPAANDRIEQAEALLQFYRNHAGLIITSRLHCALPCTAMGIPVVLLSNKDAHRMSPANDAGLRVYHTRTFTRHMNYRGGPIQRKFRRFFIYFDSLLIHIWHMLFDPIDWNPRPPDTSQIKDDIFSQLRQRFEALRKN